MKKNRSLILFWLGVFVLAVLLAAFSPEQAGVLARPQPQVTGEPSPQMTEPLPGETLAVPETGGEQAAETDALSSWVLWILLAVIVLGVIIALVARGGSSYR